jgi:hypothetical protein
MLPAGNRREAGLRLAPRCQARCRHDHRPCRQPAMRGKRVCRMHGGKVGAPKGARNGAWRHGLRSEAWRAPLRSALREAAARTRRLNAMVAIIRAETRFVRRVEVSRREERGTDGTIVRITETRLIDTRVWTDGGEARAARAIRALQRAEAPVGSAAFKGGAACYVRRRSAPRGGEWRSPSRNTTWCWSTRRRK